MKRLVLLVEAVAVDLFLAVEIEAAINLALEFFELRISGFDALAFVANEIVGRLGVRPDVIGGDEEVPQLVVVDPCTDELLSGVRSDRNLICIRREDGGAIIAQGRGAGRWPTVESVFTDVIDIWRRGV